MFVNETLIYQCFSEVYYRRVFYEYSDTQVSVSQVTQCLLKSFFERKLRRSLMEPKVVILSFGNLVHEALRAPLEKRGFTSEKEGIVPIKNVELFAHGDAVRDDCGIDHKTITRMPHEPLIHHFRQINAYIYTFGTKEWYLNYIHKPSGTVKVFRVEPYDKAWNWTQIRALRLSYSLQHNITPEPEPSWLCEFCEYTDLCPIKR